jgi:D-alanyl-D-alanine dipeptidase
MEYVYDKIMAIAIKECGESLVELKEQSIIAYGPPPECVETTPYYTKVRKTVYEKLCQVQLLLPTEWRIRLYEGFRSLSVQQLLFTQEYERVQKTRQHATHQELFFETMRLVSPVKNFDGSDNIPPHNTGGAIDIEVIDSNGLLIDMGMAIADWVTVAADTCLPETTLISAAAQNNRRILNQAMQAQGFVNYPFEWWHFSYGDRLWAYYQNKKEAIYGMITEETILHFNKKERKI